MKSHYRFSKDERNDILLKSQQCLWSKEGDPGLDYLCNIRKISEAGVKKFGLGYIPVYVNHILAGRIIFPIYDSSSNLVALGTRLIHDGSYLPVYWHESYEKSFYLYGMYLSKYSIRKWQFAILVEGQIDAIRMHDGGLTNTVALCGTKFSEVQLSCVLRYCDELVVVLDTDTNFSGQKAMDRLKKMFGSASSNKRTDSFGKSTFDREFSGKIVFIRFDEPLDPDEFISKYGFLKLKTLIKTKLLEMRNGY